jgi:hypothetical protein
MPDLIALAQKNLRERLAGNPYPGRGLILGLEVTGTRLVQVYWIMGRSENSRNRIFAHDQARVWTEPADPAKCQDPSLIIYNAEAELKGVFVVTNGDQTDTICRTLAHGGTFEQALATRDCEPDAPNYTPRISGIFDLRSGLPIARISVLRRSLLGAGTDRCTWVYDTFAPGLGYCVTTYMGDGKPLPSFAGDPYLAPLAGDACGIAQSIWGSLNADNRVSLCVKAIDPQALSSELVVVNKLKRV